MTPEEALDKITRITLSQCDRDTVDKMAALPVHPMTCGNDSRHSRLYPVYDKEKQQIRYICSCCDYTQ